MSFVHLHVHSQFSLLDSPASPESIAKHVASLGMEAVAITDSGNMYGAVAFFEACKSEGIRPVLGAVLCVQKCRAVKRACAMKCRAVQYN